jgi:ABC-type transport system involved in multi-copper enzyme maturation permease subunit
MRNIWILARMTLREAARRRIVFTGLLLGLCFVVVYSVGYHYIDQQFRVVATRIGNSESVPPVAGGQRQVASVVVREGENSLLLAGLYAATFLSIAMAALLAADTLAGEITSGTVQTIVTKPIRRSDVVLGKWLGFAFLLALYLLLIAGGVALSVLVQSGYVADNLIVGVGLIYLEALLIMTIAMACSSALSGLATGGIVFGLYGLAFIGGWIEQFGSMLQNATAVKVGIITSLIIPSETLWRRAAFEMQSPIAGALGVSPFSAVSVPSPLMIAYTVVYLLAALWIAIRNFQERDI